MVNKRHLLILFVTLFSATLCVADDMLTGTPISSTSQTLLVAANAFDGDKTTYFKGRNSDMAWVGLDLGTPHVITRIGVTPRDGITPTKRMLLAVMEGANQPDFSDAIPLHLISEEMEKGATGYFDINVSRGVRYVRFVGTDDSYCELCEMEVYGHEGEGDDSRFYQVTNLPTISIHVKNNAVPTNKGQDFESTVTIIYDNGTLIQEYPILTRVRGNFSASHENRPYRIKFNDGKSHHMFHGSIKDESPAKAKKWTLINSYGDKTLIRNNVAFEISRRARMPYTPFCRNVDVLLNGEYRGCYQLTDWLGIDDERIDIDEMTPDDIEGEALTGGYFFEMNGYANSDPVHFTSHHGNPITVHSPEDDEIQNVQFNYLKDHFNEMEERVYSDDYTDDINGYRPLLDLDTFLRYFLACEYVGNTDMIWQVFMYKRRGDDHIYTGPVWDNDLALDNDGGVYPGNKRADWTYTIRCAGQWGNFVSRILSDDRAVAQLQEMWGQLREDGRFEPRDLTYFVDSLRQEVNASQRLNFIRWPYLTQLVHCNPRVWGDWDTEVDVVRDYVEGRVEWMDKKLRYNTLETKDGAYQINSSLDMVTFSKMLNSGKLLGKVRVELNNDLDMVGYDTRFTPIGTEAHPFKGTFDGKEHVIRNLHLKGDNNVGLFGVVSGNATIENLTLDSSCSFEGNRYVGGLIGYMASGELTLHACANQATVTATGAHAGGLLGGAKSGNVAVTYCMNSGNVSANSQAAALVSNADDVNISSSYNAGSIEGSRSDKELATARALHFDNCFDIYGHQGTTITSEQVSSGELCWMLNLQTEGNVWRQNIDNNSPHDPCPVVISKHGVVFNDGGRYTNHNPNMPCFRYYKLEITKITGDNIIQLAEFDLLDEQGNAYDGLKVYKGTNSTISHEDWPNIADNDVNTKFCSQFSGSVTFLFDAGSEVAVSAYRLYTANDTQSNPNRNPISWKLYVSNDKLIRMDDNRWQLLDERKNDHTLGATNYTPYDFILSPLASIEEMTLKAVDAIVDDTLYDLLGRPMPTDHPLTPGIYIQRGRKIYIP